MTRQALPTARGPQTRMSAPRPGPGPVQLENPWSTQGQGQLGPVWTGRLSSHASGRAVLWDLAIHQKVARGGTSAAPPWQQRVPHKGTHWNREDQYTQDQPPPALAFRGSWPPLQVLWEQPFSPGARTLEQWRCTWGQCSLSKCWAAPGGGVS